MSLRNKIALWAALSAIIIAVVSLQYLRPAYRTAKMWFYIHSAEKFVQNKDYSAASLAYRKALTNGPDQVAPWKSLAGFLEQVDSPEQIDLWARLATMEPQVHAYRYKQLAAAIKFGRVQQAEYLFEQLPKEWQHEPDYLRQQAALARLLKDASTSERELARLVQMDPNDKQAVFDLACVRSTSQDASVSAAARAQLREFAGKDPQFSAAALRQLITLATQEKDAEEADRLAARLVKLPDSKIRDGLLFLQLEIMSNSWSVQSTLSDLRAYLEQHPEDFNMALEWMLNVKLDPDGTRRWIESLPPDFAKNPIVQSGLLEFYLSTKDLQKAFWLLRVRPSEFQLPSNVVDQAEQALKEERDNNPDAEQAWMRVIYEAGSNPRALQVLSLISSSQGWTRATGLALNALADAAPMQAAVWELLAQHEKMTGNLAVITRRFRG